MANIQSVVNALECFTPNIRIAETGDDLAGAAGIVLPGVGHFDEGMKGLRSRGHIAALESRVLGAGVPLLGICLGLQFLFEGSDEGIEPGLGWVSGRIKRIDEGHGVKVPHGLDNAQIDAVQMRRISRRTLVDDDVVVAFRADDVRPHLDLAEIGVAGIELETSRFARPA